MRHDLIEQLLAGEPVPGPSALDLDLDSGPALHHEAAAGLHAGRLPAPRADRALTAFEVADEDAEARSFAHRRLVGVAVAGAGSAAALLGALAIGF